MGAVWKAVAVAGTIDENRQLHLDAPLPVSWPCRVHVIILIPEDEAGIDEAEWLNATTSNPAFDFLKNPAENIYTLADGKPYGEHQCPNT